MNTEINERIGVPEYLWTMRMFVQQEFGNLGDDFIFLQEGTAAMSERVELYVRRGDDLRQLCYWGRPAMDSVGEMILTYLNALPFQIISQESYSKDSKTSGSSKIYEDVNPSPTKLTEDIKISAGVKS
jgi:hypothetical protein